MSTSAASVSPPRSAAELRSVAGVMARSYKAKPDGFLRYLKKVGRTNVLVARAGGRVAGGLAMLPCGAWFGGRAVPNAGIACVATAPELRGRGLAPGLVAECVRTMARCGIAVSTLFPTTQGLYRCAGWEQAGTMHTWKILARDFIFSDRSLEVRVAGKRDLAAVKRIHEEAGKRTSGVLKRSEWFWNRVLSREDEPRETLLALRNGRPEGYVVFALRPSTGGRWFDLGIRDWAATTPAAARRLLSAVSDQRSMCEWLTAAGSPADLMMIMPDEQRVEAVRTVKWMMRIVDVKRALEARGYPSGFSADMSVAIEDPIVPANAGRWRLRVADGRGRAERGGGGRVSIDIRGLAPLYSGMLPPEDVALAGLLDGPSDDLARLRTAFAGPVPHTTDGF